jgi:hypothetical protein
MKTAYFGSIAAATQVGQIGNIPLSLGKLIDVIASLSD